MDTLSSLVVQARARIFSAESLAEVEGLLWAVEIFPLRIGVGGDRIRLCNEA
jgi:hypothetical protein